MPASGHQIGPEEPLKIRQGGTSQEGSVGNAPQEGHIPVLEEGTREVVPDLIVLVVTDLVDNDASNAYPVNLAKDAVEVELVKRGTWG